MNHACLGMWYLWVKTIWCGSESKDPDLLDLNPLPYRVFWDLAEVCALPMAILVLLIFFYCLLFIKLGFPSVIWWANEPSVSWPTPDLSLSVLHFPGCSGVSQQACEDECDIMVPGEQLGDSTPSPQRDDLCGPRGLRAHAAGEIKLIIWSFDLLIWVWFMLISLQSCGNIYTHICIHPVYISEPEKPDIKLSVISVTAEPHSSGWLVVWRRRRRNWISCQRSVGLQTAGSSLTLKVLRARTCLWFCVCWTGPKCCLLFAVTVPQCGQTTRRHQLQPDHRWTPGQRPGQPQRGETQHTVLHHKL